MALRDKGEKTRKTKPIKDVIKGELLASRKQKKNDKINKKILLSGENGTAKTSLSLSLFTQDLADDEVIVYVDIDNSGQEIIHDFYEDLYQSGNILVYNPNAVKVNDKGVTIKDEETVVNNVTSSAEAIKELIEEDGINVRGVVVDGISFLLEFAESKMRLEKNLAVDQGANINVWKIRNKFFREFSSAFMHLDVPVIYVSHADFIPELVPVGQDLASVKRRFIDECSVRITLEKRGSIENPNVTHYVALVQKNRSDIFSVGKEVVFMSVNNKDKTIDDRYIDLYNLIFPSNDDAGNTE